MKRALIAMVCTLIINACTEEELGPLGTSTGAPETVSNIQVERLPGAVKLTYDLPEDGNLQYVMAQVRIGNSVRQQKSSVYNGFVVLEGFADTAIYDVELYAVNRAEERSKAVLVQVKPLEPPISSILKTVKMEEAFGGISVSYTNDSEAKVSIHVIAEDIVNGGYIESNTWHTESKAGAFATRGFEPEQREFGVYVADRWGNRSDTVYAGLVPLFEERIAAESFRALVLPTDMPAAYATSISNLWDGRIGDNYFHTAGGTGMPQWFSMDLGNEVKISRIKYFQRTDMDLVYALGNPRHFEIWGSNNPSADGSWDSWIKITECKSIKPSGETGGITSEDLAFAAAGEDFEFPLDAPGVRYIRIKTLRTWADTDFIHISELQFWGQVVQ